MEFGVPGSRENTPQSLANWRPEKRFYYIKKLSRHAWMKKKMKLDGPGRISNLLHRLFSQRQIVAYVRTFSENRCVYA